jgi:hypothetical protein
MRDVGYNEPAWTTITLVQDNLDETDDVDYSISQLPAVAQGSWVQLPENPRPENAKPS